MTEFLNWRTDPLLVDPTPIEQNKWQTANSLLETGKRNRFLSPIKQLHLFPIMIRRADFIKGERILQSFPYIVLDQEWISNLRKTSLTLAEKTHHYFLKSNYNRSIRKWQQKIVAYLEKQHRLPFPLFRLTANWLDYFFGKESIGFQSARGEAFQLPNYLTEDLAYLSGVVIGDGHLANYFVNIIDYSKEHIELIAALLMELFQSNIEIFKQSNANAWNVNILGKWIVRFFNFLSGQPINARKYPALREPLIFQKNDLFRKAFWRGVMDADGSYKTAISFGSSSQRFLSNFSAYLSQHNILCRFYTQSAFGGTSHSFTVAGESRKRFAKLIGTAHPQKQVELQLLLKRKVYPFSPRISTLEKQGFWKDQVIAFNTKKMLAHYFDFNLIPDLRFRNIGKTIQYLREKYNHKQKHLSSQLSISPSLLSKYELDKTAIPVRLFTNMLSVYDLSLRDFLIKYNHLTLQVHKSTCQFPTHPIDAFFTILKGLQLKDRGYFTVIGLPDYSITQYKNLLSKYFNIPKPQTRKFYNMCLSKLTHEFCILRS